jgi:hypothetical protein
VLIVRRDTISLDGVLHWRLIWISSRIRRCHTSSSWSILLVGISYHQLQRANVAFPSEARVLLDYSFLPTALSWKDEALTALTFYLAESYITDLRDFHTLYTVPLTTKFKHTHLKPQVVPFCYGAGATYLLSERAISVCDNVAIVLLGMFGGRTPPDLLSATKSVIPATTTYISRRLFLDSILRALEQVNEKTAIVASPNFAQLDAGESFLQLSAHGAVYKKRGLPFAWKKGTVEEGLLKYEWSNRDEWRYEHVGDFVSQGESGSYYVTRECILLCIGFYAQNLWT